MKPTPLLQLSGESGGGQLLRSALSLAMVTGQGFRMTAIRGKRPKPGLMRQHLTSVKAAAEICDGVVDGAEIGSTELVFVPGAIRGWDYSFSIGTGGSTHPGPPVIGARGGPSRRSVVSPDRRSSSRSGSGE